MPYFQLEISHSLFQTSHLQSGSLCLSDSVRDISLLVVVLLFSVYSVISVVCLFFLSRRHKDTENTAFSSCKSRQKKHHSSFPIPWRSDRRSFKMPHFLLGMLHS